MLVILFIVDGQMLEVVTDAASSIWAYPLKTNWLSISLYMMSMKIASYKEGKHIKYLGFFPQSHSDEVSRSICQQRLQATKRASVSST